MRTFQQASDAAIRSDLIRAYEETWRRLALPGTWWTAQQRIDIAQEVRNARGCEYCAKRRAALSPYAVAGAHESNTALPPAAIDAIHRITTDASRLSSDALLALNERGISDGHYVELLGVAVAVISVDDFHSALGWVLPPLPMAASNELPTHYRPPGARDYGAWVPMLMPTDLSAEERDLYDGAAQSSNVLAALSLVPDSVRLLKLLAGAQYLEPQEVLNPRANGGRALSRAQIELLAGRVSALNQCFY